MDMKRWNTMSIEREVLLPNERHALVVSDTRTMLRWERYVYNGSVCSMLAGIYVVVMQARLYAEYDITFVWWLTSLLFVVGLVGTALTVRRDALRTTTKRLSKGQEKW